MAIDSDLPRKGERIETPEGIWDVQEVIVLGTRPLHFAVRIRCTPGKGGTAYNLLLSRSEYQALVARRTGPAQKR